LYNLYTDIQRGFQEIGGLFYLTYPKMTDTIPKWTINVIAGTLVILDATELRMARPTLSFTVGNAIIRKTNK
jgi:hypothetical protein